MKKNLLNYLKSVIKTSRNLYSEKRDEKLQ